MDTFQAVIIILSFVGCFFFTGKAIYHIAYVLNNVTGKYASFLAPFLIFMPSQFNDLGNKHRAMLLPALLGVSVCWLTLILFSALGK